MSVWCTGDNRQPPVDDYRGVDLAVGGTNDVIGFDVAMNDASTVDLR